MFAIDLVHCNISLRQKSIGNLHYIHIFIHLFSIVNSDMSVLLWVEGFFELFIAEIDSENKGREWRMMLYFREGHVSSNQIVDLKIRPQDAKIHVDSHLVDTILSTSAIFKHCY